MNFEKLTENTQQILVKSQELCTSNKNQAIEPGHVLKFLIEDRESIQFLLHDLNVETQILEPAVEAIINSYSKVEGGSV